MNNENYLVSIIMPAYNSEAVIRESINSVICQTYSNWELVICDDGSTDNTGLILKEYNEKDPRVKVISNVSGVKGAASARNCALNVSTGRYISFLDSDDTWLSRKLELQLGAMNEGNYSVSHSSYIRVDENGKELNKVKCMELVTYKDQVKSNRIPNLTGVYDRDSIGLILQNNIGHEDYDMWLEILSKADSVGIQEPLANYRVSSTSLSSNKIKAAIWHFKILNKQDNISFIFKVYYYYCYIFNALLKRI
ncbi:glycosyltransferase family 2 protein [Vibrio kanaloae]|uniref:Glycosyltransferase family 2 protein n=1 Tax=Vibrio kanaloae TaxID=170673 RepID=A0A4U1ZMQ6_9VIBR|nr:glycosyltransferase family 2 protein [Vibrio kanaloae]TKF34097.1 glycosyltransferase family 2 protein [Vibrio kanaloae]